MMKSITMITCSMISAMLAASPAFSAENPFMAELHARLNSGKKPVLKKLPTIQEEPTPTELPSKVETSSFKRVNYKDLKSSESINLCLISGVHGTHNFHNPLEFLTSEGMHISTTVTQISIGIHQTFKSVVTPHGTHEMKDSTAHKFFTDREAFKEWLNKISEGIVE